MRISQPNHGYPAASGLQHYERPYTNPFMQGVLAPTHELMPLGEELDGQGGLRHAHRPSAGEIDHVCANEQFMGVELRNTLLLSI